MWNVVLKYHSENNSNYVANLNDKNINKNKY